MRVLIVEAVDSFREMATLELEVELKAEVVALVDNLAAEEYLSSGAVCDIIILGNLGLQELAPHPHLIKFVKSVPTLFFSNYPLTTLAECNLLLSENLLSRYLGKPCSISKFIQTVAEMTKSQIAVDQEYCQIQSRRLMTFNMVVCDVYLKLSDEKYIKIINANDLYDSELLQKYIEKGVTHFYLKRETYQDFSKSYYRYLREQLASKTTTPSEKILIELESVASIRERALNLGIDNDCIALCDQINNSCLNFVKKHQSFNDIFRIFNSAGTYITDHSLLLSYISVGIARSSGMMSDSMLRRLCFASILHDLFLDDRQARLADGFSGLIQEMPSSDAEVIKKHTLEIFLYVEKNRLIPEDVSGIVLSHHERPDGSGYPRGLTAQQISPLAALFIIAEDLVTRVMLSPETLDDKDSLFSYFKGHYNFGNFVKPLLALEKFLKSPR